LLLFSFCIFLIFLKLPWPFHSALVFFEPPDSSFMVYSNFSSFIMRSQIHHSCLSPHNFSNQTLKKKKKKKNGGFLSLSKNLSTLTSRYFHNHKVFFSSFSWARWQGEIEGNLRVIEKQILPPSSCAMCVFLLTLCYRVGEDLLPISLCAFLFLSFSFPIYCVLPMFLGF
jgi:hypothetical protein